MFVGAGGIVAGVLAGGILAALPWRGAYPEITRPDPGTYSAATIERGRLTAAVGACNVCHTGSDGTPFAGGRAFDTPFGVVHATNITPDAENGIGAWSYPAFERAMRQGVRRDGKHLYPVHPYPSFAGATDADLQALYAFLMTQAPSPAKTTNNALRFPFNIRPLLAGWNMLFAGGRTVPTDTTKDEAWNRGAYLVETLGHCGACHTPRNALGAEKKGDFHLAGGVAEGWDAPALNGTSLAPVRWSQTALYDYLRTGTAKGHGSAGGPMGAVVKALAPLPDSDIQAMATYLAGFSGQTEEGATAQQTTVLANTKAAEATAARIAPVGARLFEGACSACHTETSPLGSLTFNSNLHADRPDNILLTMMHGTEAPALLAQKAGADAAEIMSMPAYGEALSDRQLTDLAAYLRARFAPDKPAWQELGAAIERTRAVHPMD